MELVTSHYAAWRPGMGSPVVASLLVPKWRPEAATWPRCWLISPRWDYFKAAPAEFDAAYLAQLERFGVQRIMRTLAKIAREAFEEPSQRLCILCWEHDPAACHRGTFAAWLLARTGELVKEATP